MALDAAASSADNPPLGALPTFLFLQGVSLRGCAQAFPWGLAHGQPALLSSIWLCDPPHCSLRISVRGFPRQAYWSGLPFPPLGDLPDPGIQPASPALAGFLTAEPAGEPKGQPGSSQTSRLGFLKKLAVQTLKLLSSLVRVYWSASILAEPPPETTEAVKYSNCPSHLFGSISLSPSWNHGGCTQRTQLSRNQQLLVGRSARPKSFHWCSKFPHLKTYTLQFETSKEKEIKDEF